MPHKTKSSDRARRRRAKWSAVRRELLEGDPLRVWWIANGWPELYLALYENMDSRDRERMDAIVEEGGRMYEERKAEGA